MAILQSTSPIPVAENVVIELNDQRIKKSKHAFKYWYNVVIASFVMVVIGTLLMKTAAALPLKMYRYGMSDDWYNVGISDDEAILD